MTERPPPPAADRPSVRPASDTARTRRKVAIVALMATTALGLVIGTAWLNRRVVAREMLVGWLDDRGVPATVRVDRLELDGFVGRIVVGDPRDPDFAGDVTVDYRLVGPWSGAGLGVTPSRILLTRPVLKARWSHNRFSMGALDPVVEQFTGRPPRPDSRSPLIVVQGGRLSLATDYGPVTAFADLSVDNGKLMRLQARTPDLRLAQGDTRAAGLRARLDLTTIGDRVAVGLNLGVADLAGPTLSGRNARLGFVADLPYPDLKTRRGDGRAFLDLSLSGDALSLGGVSTTAPQTRLKFKGQTTGWIETFRIAGDLTGDLRASALTGQALSAVAPHLALTSTRLDLSRQDAGALAWSATGPATMRATRASAGDLTLSEVVLRSSILIVGGRGAGVEATGPLSLAAATASFGDLALTGLTGTADVDVVQRHGLLVQATGAMKAAGGRWPLFGPSGPDEIPELATMKAALGDFAVDLPAFRLSAGTPGTRFDLSAPARLTPRNGGVLTLLPVARPIFSAAPGEGGGGALKLTATRGQGLPEATFDVPEWRLTPSGFSARLDGHARLDFGLAQGLSVTTAGILATDRGVLTYVAARCLDVTVERLELGETDVFDLAGRACPVSRPLAEVRDGRWRADLGLKAFSAKAPFLALDVDRIEGTAAVTGSPAGIGLTADIASARVTDATTPRRFNPLSASGAATLRDESWTGGFDLTSGQTKVAHLDLTHDGLTGRGGVAIDTGTLTFAPGGLQPVDLTPLVAGIVSPPVTGAATFKGQLAWDPVLPEGISSGRLTIPDLAFTSPAGPVQGLRGTIDFTNLAPLTTAPGQILHVDKLVTITDLTDLDVNFALGKAAVTVSGAEIQVAGGFIRVEPFLLPLDRTTPFDGVIVFDRVQLGELVKGAGFDDKVSLDAVVSGRLPFTYDPVTGVRIQAGSLAAVQPGRLSIQREALSGIEAGGGGAIPPGTVEDLAYQAMENLAFDTLSAGVNSEGDGRVRLMFAIKGRHDPPERQELRLTIPELISRQFLNRPLPLPSDTGIDLNLNTTLNLNEVVGDLLAINRARNAAPVTPAAPSGTSPLP